MFFKGCIHFIKVDEVIGIKLLINIFNDTLFITDVGNLYSQPFCLDQSCQKFTAFINLLMNLYLCFYLLLIFHFTGFSFYVCLGLFPLFSTYLRYNFLSQHYLWNMETQEINFIHIFFSKMNNGSFIFPLSSFSVASHKS